jgi:uncharacterized protein (TIGR03663 family)
MSTEPLTNTATNEVAETPPPGPWRWRIYALSILAVGAVLRLYNLTLVPLHHDEGVNGSFLLQVVHNGTYKYDPQNYHGTTLFYFAAIIPGTLRFLFGPAVADTHGLTTFNLRLVTAVFGIATIWLVLTLRRHVGMIGALAGAALLAVSPGAVYLSRYFIHETLFVFFTLAAVVAGLRFYETTRVVYLMLATAAAALLFATKETAMISAGVILIAFATTALIVKLRARFQNRGKASPAIGNSEPLPEPLSESLPESLPAPNEGFVTRFGGRSSLIITAIAALSLFLSIEILFYSSFFTNYPQGVYDSLSTFRFWSQTSREVHGHPWWTYAWWLVKEESPLLFLGFAGLTLAVWRGTNRFAIFTGLWAFGLIAAYSLIFYKTPWLMLSFVVPLAIISGYAFEEIYRRTKQPMITLALVITALAMAGYQMIELNFDHYDEPAYVYPYVHTVRDVFSLLDEVDRIAKRAGTGEETPIVVASPDYWPLPWYLAKYAHVEWPKHLDQFNQPMVIINLKQSEEFLTKNSFGYELSKGSIAHGGSYPLRPGVELLLFVRRDLAER